MATPLVHVRLVNGQFSRRPVSLRCLLVYGAVAVGNCAVWFGLGWFVAR